MADDHKVSPRSTAIDEAPQPSDAALPPLQRRRVGKQIGMQPGRPEARRQNQHGRGRAAHAVYQDFAHGPFCLGVHGNCRKRLLPMSLDKFVTYLPDRSCGTPPQS